MNHCHQNHDARNTAAQIRLVDNTCHIKLGPGSEDHFDMVALWCSLCQKPRFGDDVYTDICVCTSFTDSIDLWLQQPGDDNIFEDLQTSQYDAIDSWLNMSVNNDTYQNQQTSHSNAMMDFSTLPTSTGVQSLSSATSTTSTIPPCERRSLEVDHRDWLKSHRTMTSKLKRREQNRNSQRSFRERKNQITKDLQDRVEELTKLNEKLCYEVCALRREIGRAEGKIA